MLQVDFFVSPISRETMSQAICGAEAVTATRLTLITFEANVTEYGINGPCLAHLAL
jgi:hypothetical protein